MQLYGSDLCSCCGKQLNPPYDKIYRHGKKILCDNCEQERASKAKLSQNSSKVEQEDKAFLFQTIQEMFRIETIPEWWITQIEKMHKEGKTYLGMAYTIKYAVLYQGFILQEDYGISGVISIFYNEASQNYEKEEKVREINDLVNINQTKKIIRIKPPKVDKWKPTSNIEDL